MSKQYKSALSLLSLDKHEQKNAHICHFCDKSFSSRQAVHRHTKKYCKNNSMIEQTSDNTKDFVALWDTINKMQNEIALMSTKTCVSTFMKDAPPIEHLSDTKSTLLLFHTSSKIEDDFIFYHDKKILHQFLGDIIVKEYKKNNPFVQSFWSTDTTRLTFVIKKIFEDESNSKWIIDKNGTNLNTFIITPLVQKVKKILQSYIKICHKKCTEIATDPLTRIDESITNNMLKANEIIQNINTKQISSEILKYISPYFNLDVSKIDKNDYLEKVIGKKFNNDQFSDTSADSSNMSEDDC